MTTPTDKIPLTLKTFLEQHGKDPCVGRFSPEATEAILARIKDFDDKNPETQYDWREFFTKSKEVWAEGVLVIPRDQLKLEESDIAQLDEIKAHKKADTRCAELIYKTAVDIAHRNGFIVLSKTSMRFVVDQ